MVGIVNPPSVSLERGDRNGGLRATEEEDVALFFDDRKVWIKSASFLLIMPKQFAVSLTFSTTLASFVGGRRDY